MIGGRRVDGLMGQGMGWGQRKVDKAWCLAMDGVGGFSKIEIACLPLAERPAHWSARSQFLKPCVRGLDCRQ